MASIVPVVEPARSEEGKVLFTGEKGPLLRLLVKNTLLTGVTLGIYRFWAKTELRRWYWSHIRLEGAPLEYTGRGIELFKGFLIAIAILAGLSIVVGITLHFLASVDPILETVGNLAYSLFLLALFQVAAFRATRYRLSRTTWCGIRFGLAGDSGEVLRLGLLYGLLTAVTLGIGYPWMRMALLKYRIDHMRFGTGAFAFAGKGRDLLLSWLAPWSSFAILVGLFVYAAATAEGQGKGELPLPIFLAMVALIAGASIAYAWYRVEEFRYVAAQTFFGDAAFYSGLTFGRIMFVLAMVGLGTGLAFVVLALLFGFGGATLGPLAAIVMIPLFYLAMSLGVGLVRYVVTREVANTLEVKKGETFHGAVQGADRGPRQGEGLADALDVDAF